MNIVSVAHHHDRAHLLVRERDNKDGEKGRERVPDIVPVDVPHVANHQRPDDDQCTTCRPRRYGRKDRSKEDRHEEQQSRHDSRDTRLPAL